MQKQGDGSKKKLKKLDPPVQVPVKYPVKFMVRKAGEKEYSLHGEY